MAPSAYNGIPSARALERNGHATGPETAALLTLKTLRGALTLSASAAAGVWDARDAPPGLNGTMAGRRDADDAELAPLPSWSSGPDAPPPAATPPGVPGEGAGDMCDPLAPAAQQTRIVH